MTFSAQRVKCDIRRTVEFDVNGGVSASYYEKDYFLGQQYGQFPSARREGYSLSAWCSDPECRNAVLNSDKVDFRVGKLYAGWKMGEGMTELEYIEGTGAQWIDTGILSQPNLKTEIDIQFNSVDTTQQRLFGISNNNTGSYQYIMYINGVRCWATASIASSIGDWTSTTIQSNTDRHKFILWRGRGVWIDGVENTKNNYKNDKSTVNSSTTIYLLNGSGNSGDNVISNAKLYSFDMSIGDNYIMRLIPAKDPEGIACMYDRVSRTFFYNKGTGNFIAGPEKR